MNQSIIKQLIQQGVKNLQEFGYPSVNKAELMTDPIYKAFFRKMLEESLGQGFDAEVNDLLQQISDESKVWFLWDERKGDVTTCDHCKKPIGTTTKYYIVEDGSGKRFVLGPGCVKKLTGKTITEIKKATADAIHNRQLGFEKGGSGE